MITPSSTAIGVVSNIQCEATGSGSLVLGGNYSGSDDLDYIIQFTTAGEVGAAVYKWSDDNGATFTTGVTITSIAVALSNGLTVYGVSGVGTDFAVDDVHRAMAIVPYGRTRLLDLDNDTEHRTANALAQLSYVIDFGEAKNPGALIVGYHNWTQRAVIRLQANVTNTWASPSVNEAVTWHDKSIVHYVQAERARYRYWRLFVDNIGNSDGFYRAANLYLGRVLELSSVNEISRRRRRVSDRKILASGRPSGGALARVSEFSLQWPALSKSDRDAMVALFENTTDLTTYQVSPVYLDPDSDLGEVLLCEWEDSADVSDARDAPYRFNLPVSLVEVPRTV